MERQIVEENMEGRRTRGRTLSRWTDQIKITEYTFTKAAHHGRSIDKHD